VKNSMHRGSELQSKNENKKDECSDSDDAHYERNMNNFIHVKEKFLKMIFKRKCSVIDLA
jgi:hypothetical protein